MIMRATPKGEIERRTGFRPRFEVESLRCVCGTYDGNNRVCVDASHVRDLLCFHIIVVLNYAKTIAPEIFQSQSSGDMHSYVYIIWNTGLYFGFGENIVLKEGRVIAHHGL